MNVCKKCGFELTEGVLFCKKCGTPVEVDNSTKMDEENVIENLTKCSTEMRELSDRMISTYVKAVKVIELELEKTKAEADKKISVMQKQISEHEGEVKRYKAYVSELEERVKKADEYANQLVSEKVLLEEENKKLLLQLQAEAEKTMVQPVIQPVDVNPAVCPNCGEVIDDDMVFCGNCGKKLI